MAKSVSLKVEDYVDAVAKSTGTTKKAAREVIKEFLSQVAENTVAGKTTQLVGLGKISIREVEAATKRNPRTGQPAFVEAHRKPKFGFSGKIRNKLRGIEDNSADE
jgi:DNA-binding protein HU-beta